MEYSTGLYPELDRVLEDETSPALACEHEATRSKHGPGLSTDSGLVYDPIAN